MKTFYQVAGIILFIVLVFWFGRFTKNCPQPEIRIDTITVFDTIREKIPEYINRYVVKTDSVPYYIYGVDTVIKYVYLPIERKEYKTDNYFAIVEGYNPSLYYIETYNKTSYIDRVQKIYVKPRWGIGVQIGYGYNLNDRFFTYIGVGLQYNLLTW